MRKNLEKVPFSKLYFSNLIGTYDEDEKPHFKVDNSINKLKYNGNSIQFDTLNNDLISFFSAGQDFTFSPIFVMEKEGKTYLGLIGEELLSVETERADDSIASEKVCAPFLLGSPLVLECRITNSLQDVIGKDICVATITADIINVNVSEFALDETGELDFQKAIGKNAWAAIRVES